MLRPEPWALAGGKGQASGDTKQGGIGPGHCAGYREADDGELWADSAASVRPAGGQAKPGMTHRR
jgi:hypothetical protein